MLSIIAALNEDNLIGRNNSLIWHIPEDLKRFKKITSGKTIIMGRKTFESLPSILPNRKHIIITRNMKYSIPEKSVKIIHSINDISRYIKNEEEAFVIGGSEIYKQLLPYCHKLYLTLIKSKENGDAYFPKFNKNYYTIVEFEKHHYDKIEYNFITFEKN